MPNETAKVVRFHALGGPEVLKIEAEPVPAPGKGEALLRVKAIGLNRAEVMFRQGRYLESPFPALETRLRSRGRSDRGGPGRGQELDRQESQHGAGVPDDAVRRVRRNRARSGERARDLSAESCTPEEGTSIWMQYLTAYGALIHYAHIGKGDFVVITAASSSVGIAAIEMAKAEGAMSIATTRTSKKKAKLIELGAAHVIATDEEDSGGAREGNHGWQRRSRDF